MIIITGPKFVGMPPWFLGFAKFIIIIIIIIKQRRLRAYTNEREMPIKSII